MEEYPNFSIIIERIRREVLAANLGYLLSTMKVFVWIIGLIDVRTSIPFSRSFAMDSVLTLSFFGSAIQNVTGILPRPFLSKNIDLDVGLLFCDFRFLIVKLPVFVGRTRNKKEKCEKNRKFLAHDVNYISTIFLSHLSPNFRKLSSILAIITSRWCNSSLLTIGLPVLMVTRFPETFTDSI